jgi:prephenate dehydratase
MKVAIQGIPGSFHHQVALDLFGNDVEVCPFRTFEEVARSTSNGQVEVAIMAIENSIAGAILPNYELIDRHDLKVTAEYYLPISHNLMVLKGQEIKDIKEVRSHPMALLQCKKFFQNFPEITLIDDLDTASVAKRIADEKLKEVAGVASKSAAEYYGLEILAEDIQTVKDNFTRFIILKKESAKSKEPPEKVSLKITTSNEKGSLAKMLTILSEYGLNLSKIQSMPVIDKPWNYAFFIDAEIENYSLYKHALREVRNNGYEVKILGEYVRGRKKANV